MKQLKFRHNLVSRILEGEKKSTWRLFDEKDLSEGDRVRFIDGQTGEHFATAKITRVEEKQLKRIDETTLRSHDFENLKKTIKHFQNIYSQIVTAETPVKMIEFILIS